MPSRAVSWVLLGSAAAIATFVAIRRLGRADTSTSSVEQELEPSSDAELRNAGLIYRPVGASGERYPDWVRALDGKSGVYVIKEVQRDGTAEVVYVGESHTARLYDTLTRHLQNVRHEAQEDPMT